MGTCIGLCSYWNAIFPCQTETYYLLNCSNHDHRTTCLFLTNSFTQDVKGVPRASPSRACWASCPMDCELRWLGTFLNFHSIFWFVPASDLSLGSLYTTCFFRCCILPNEPLGFLSSYLSRVSFHTCSPVTGMPISLGIALHMHYAGLGVWQAPLPPSASERRRILPCLSTDSKFKRESGNYPADSGYIFKAALEFWSSSSFLLTYHNLAQQLSILSIHKHIITLNHHIIIPSIHPIHVYSNHLYPGYRSSISSPPHHFFTSKYSLIHCYPSHLYPRQLHHGARTPLDL
jgi:hypothetical protein